MQNRIICSTTSDLGKPNITFTYSKDFIMQFRLQIVKMEHCWIFIFYGDSVLFEVNFSDQRIRCWRNNEPQLQGYASSDEKQKEKI